MAEKCPVDNKTLAAMERQCNEYSCDGCPGVEVGCLGRDWKTHRVAATLEATATENETLRAAIEFAYEVLGEHSDDDADPHDTSPEDAAAWRAGVVRRRLLPLLDKGD